MDSESVEKRCNLQLGRKAITQGRKTMFIFTSLR